MGKFLVGFQRVVITPPLGAPTSLAGYAGRTQFATGIRDDIYASAVVVDDGRKQVAIVSCDLLGTTFDTIDEAKRVIEEQTGIPPENVLVHCTHTHQAPDLLGIFQVGKNFEYHVDEDYLKIFPRYVAGAVVGAFHKRMPARMWHGKGWGAGFARNRRFDLPTPEPNYRTIDPDVGVVKFEHASTGRLLGVIVNFTAHPTVYGTAQPLVSSDYIGALRQALARELGPEPVLVYINGASGDVGPRDPTSFPPLEFHVDDGHGASGRRKAVTGDWGRFCKEIGLDPAEFPSFYERLSSRKGLPARFSADIARANLRFEVDGGKLTATGFSELEPLVPLLKRALVWFVLTSGRGDAAINIGEGLARVVLDALDGAGPGDGDSSVTVDSVLSGVEVKFDDPDMALEVPQFHQSSHYSRRGDEHFLNIPVQVVRVGRVLLVGIPGEPINEIGLRLKQILGEHPEVDTVLVSEISNGMIAYILTPKEWDCMGYEVSISIGRDVGDLVEHEVLELGGKLLGTKFEWREEVVLPDVEPADRIVDRLKISVGRA
ncbi:MAG: neutral/alkaline non-lysosomal ceramidase N-terminal domain-containing protein [Promethearchaeota archaeon]